MKIQGLTIKNFRCLESIDDLPLGNLAVFVGRNGSGKSSILHAIEVLFTPDYKISVEDFFNRDTSNPIGIQAAFCDFTPEERKEFDAYIQKGKMTITKKISWDAETETPKEEYFSYKTQIPEFAEIREKEGAREKTAALKELLGQGNFPDFTGKFRSAPEALQLMNEYEEKHPQLCKLTEAKFHFFGAKHVGGGKLDKYTRFVLLPAVKEVSEEIEGRDSAIEQLLNLLVLKEMESRSDLVEFREKMTKKILQKFSPESLGGLSDISSRLTDKLKLYSPGSAIMLHWGEIEPPEFELPTIKCGVIEDGFEGSVSNKGHGLQRALILTLIEHLAGISAREEAESEEKKSKKLRIDTLLAVEEPEIYLHPSRSRYLSNILLKLTENRKYSSTQVIYTTHSPYFVAMDRFNSIRVCRKKEISSAAACTAISRYDLQSANERLEATCGRCASISNPQANFRIRAIPAMSTVVSEGFFANLIVLVEGPTDAIVLWKVQERLGSNWDKRSISLIPALGKENIIKPKIVFDGLDIPNYVVFDRDRSHDRINTQMAKLLGIVGNILPPKKIHARWACNNKKLEDELDRMLTHKKVEQIWSIVGKELGCDEPWIREKTEPLARFVEIVYEKGLSLPHYESIVKRINSLYKDCKCPEAS